MRNSAEIDAHKGTRFGDDADDLDVRTSCTVSRVGRTSS